MTTDLDAANRRLLTQLPVEERAPFVNLIITALHYGVQGPPEAVIEHAARELRARERSAEWSAPHRESATRWLVLIATNAAAMADLVRYYVAFTALSYDQQREVKAQRRLERLQQGRAA